MTIAESMLFEFDHEMATTRALLERVPDGDADWKPHPKSYSMGELAIHVATIPMYAIAAVERTEFDFNPPGGPAYASPRFESASAAVRTFDDLVKTARAAIARTADADMMTKWALRNAGHTIVELPRVAVLRTLVMNHLIHHRGQLSVYLRLRDVPLPSIYGPTADTA